MNAFLWFYLLPLVLSFTSGLFIGYNEIKVKHGHLDDYGYCVASIIPFFNFFAVYEGLYEIIINVDRLELPTFQRISPEAKKKIKASKENLKKEIEKLKNEHRTTVKEIKTEDEQNVLLKKLGLTKEDLEKLKELKK